MDCTSRQLRNSGVVSKKLESGDYQLQVEAKLNWLITSQSPTDIPYSTSWVLHTCTLAYIIEHGLVDDSNLVLKFSIELLLETGKNLNQGLWKVPAQPGLNALAVKRKVLNQALCGLCYWDLTFRHNRILGWSGGATCSTMILVKRLHLKCLH